MFEVGPTFFGKNPEEQQIIIGALKSGKINRKSWIEKERKVDVFDIKADVIKTHGNNKLIKKRLKAINFTDIESSIDNTIKWYKKNKKFI